MVKGDGYGDDASIETVEKWQNRSLSVIARSVATKQSLFIAGYEIATLPAVARNDHLNVLINSLVSSRVSGLRLSVGANRTPRTEQ